MTEEEYSKPSHYDTTSEPKARRVRVPDMTPRRRHGKHLRGGFCWLVMGTLIVLYQLHAKVVGIEITAWVVTLCSIIGFFALFIGGATICNEWRKEI